MKNLKGLLLCEVVGMPAACSGNKTVSGLDPARFDSIINGKPVSLYILTNRLGMEACITNFGGRVVSLMVPDRQGKLQELKDAKQKKNILQGKLQRKSIVILDLK